MELIAQDYQRYSRKGWSGLLLMLLLNFFIYCLIPSVVRNNWHEFFPEKPNRNKYLLIQSLSHFLIFLFWNSLYLILYCGYCSSLQKCKISPEPWPW